MLDEYIIRAIIALILLAINASIAGSFTVFKNVPFLIAGSSHAALAGAALFIFLEIYGINIDPLIGAVIFAVFIAVAASVSKQMNVAIGIAFAFSMSIAVLFISMIKEQASRVWGLLFGDLFLLTNHDIILMAIVTTLVLIFFLIFHKEFLFISFDPEGAMAYGVKVRRFTHLLLSLIAISTVIAMKAVGAILAYAMLIAPAAAANEKAKSILQVFSLSAFLALIAGFSGMTISFFFPVSPSAISAIIATSFYFVFRGKMFG